MKYARMYHSEKKIQKNFPKGPHENVWGPRENVSPGPAVALDGPVPHTSKNSNKVFMMLQ